MRAGIKLVDAKCWNSAEEIYKEEEKGAECIEEERDSENSLESI